MQLGDSRLLYTLVIGAVAATRLAELGLSRRNLRRLRAAGGIEHGATHYPLMVAVHAGLLASCVLEVWLLRRPWIPGLARTMLVILAATMAVRLWVMVALGERWVTRVVVLPGVPLVTSGPYRWLRHPNYMAVAFEVVTLPLMHAAWLTAVGFALLNAAVLAVRVRVENEALRTLWGSDES